MSFPPRQPTSWQSLVGVARQVRHQSAPHRGRPAAHQLLTFRLVTVDQTGRVGNQVALELRGHDIIGNVEEGDWIEVSGRIKEGGRVKSLTNLTTGSTVRSKSSIFTAP
jgi:hypothetical protein